MSETALKLLLLFLAGAALLAVARWASGRGEENHSRLRSGPAGLPGLDNAPHLPEIPPTVAEPAARSSFRAFVPEPELGPVRITGFNFATFDADPGPADADVFADELFVELYDEDTGHTWRQSYFVASPNGLERLLQDRHWESVFAHDVFVFRRYALAEIRRTLLEHIAEEQKLVRSGDQE